MELSKTTFRRLSPFIKGLLVTERFWLLRVFAMTGFSPCHEGWAASNVLSPGRVCSPAPQPGPGQLLTAGGHGSACSASRLARGLFFLVAWVAPGRMGPSLTHPLGIPTCPSASPPLATQPLGRYSCTGACRPTDRCPAAHGHSHRPRNWRGRSNAGEAILRWLRARVPARHRPGRAGQPQPQPQPHPSRPPGWQGSTVPSRLPLRRRPPGRARVGPAPPQ